MILVKNSSQSSVQKQSWVLIAGLMIELQTSSLARIRPKDPKYASYNPTTFLCSILALSFLLT